MIDFISSCNYLSPLTSEAEEDLHSRIKIRDFKKGDYLLIQGKACRYLYFLQSGLLKMFRYADGKEFIMNFFQEGLMFTELNSFPDQLPSDYNIIVLEDVTVQYISNTSLEALCEKHHCIETFYRKLLHQATENMMHRISEMLIQNPTDHYHQFVETHNKLVQRLSLGDQACYLGITQVSLSRIRAKK